MSAVLGWGVVAGLVALAGIALTILGARLSPRLDIYERPLTDEEIDGHLEAMWPGCTQRERK